MQQLQVPRGLAVSDKVQVSVQVSHGIALFLQLLDCRTLAVSSLDCKRQENRFAQVVAVVLVTFDPRLWIQRAAVWGTYRLAKHGMALAARLQHYRNLQEALAPLVATGVDPRVAMEYLVILVRRILPVPLDAIDVSPFG